jgi:hypothetical protein
MRPSSSTQGGVLLYRAAASEGVVLDPLALGFVSFFRDFVGFFGESSPSRTISSASVAYVIFGCWVPSSIPGLQIIARYQCALKSKTSNEYQETAQGSSTQEGFVSPHSLFANRNKQIFFLEDVHSLRPFFHFLKTLHTRKIPRDCVRCGECR